ncbi:DNA ligase [Aliikangiella maris]|uniref:DNA ligase n=2 Tax=Aliikangiella maris TaxID=3162458 RepID=A0ABV2BVI6_9GAMM
MSKLTLTFGITCYLLPVGWTNLHANLPIEQNSIPPLLLAKSYQATTQLDQFFVSEKLDGVRAFWNGTNFITRGGHLINCPPWFTERFPRQAMDGELWLGRGQFDAISGLVRQKIVDELRWKKVTYQVFDLPQSLLPFEQRYINLKSLVKNHHSPYLSLVKQFSIQTKSELDDRLSTVVAKGGEGLMLHKKDSIYQASRSNDLQKLKPFNDAEATVIRHISGKGKYKNLLGAIEVINQEGVKFKIGSGFSLHERYNPPPINSVITYRYRGKTKKNIPRFATYLRQKITGQ